MQMGRSFFRRQSRLCRGHWEGRSFHATRVWSVSLMTTFCCVLYAHRLFKPDRLSVHDPKDPTCARPETRELAQHNCAEHMSSWASSSDNLAGLRIGIPQVGLLSYLSCCSSRIFAVCRNISPTHCRNPSSPRSEALSAHSKLGEPPLSPFPCLVPHMR